MFCKHCGYRLEQGENFCVKCGTPVGNYNNQPMMPPMPMPHPMMPPQPMYFSEPARPTCGTALVSMVLGLTSIFIFGLLTSIPAIVLGASSLKKIDRENLDGRAYALTGLTSGIIVTTIWTIIILMVFFLAIITSA